MQNVWHLFATKILHCVKATKLFCCYLVPTRTSDVRAKTEGVCNGWRRGRPGNETKLSLVPTPRAPPRVGSGDETS